MKSRLAALAPFAFGLAIGAAAQQPQQGKILYYRDPMDRPYYSAEPKKDEMGMDYIPVYKGEEDSGQAPSAPPQGDFGRWYRVCLRAFGRRECWLCFKRIWTIAGPRDVVPFSWCQAMSRRLKAGRVSPTRGKRSSMVRPSSNI